MGGRRREADDVPAGPSAAVRAGIDEAVAAGDWTTAVELFEANVVALVLDHYPWTCRLMAAVPDEQPLGPVGRVVRGFLVGRPGGSLPGGVDDADSPPISRLAAALLQVVTLRMRGRLDEAELVVRAVVPVADAIEAAGLDDRVAFVRFHFGLLRLLRGDLDAAIDDLQVANLAARYARSAFLLCGSAGDLALLHAVRGELTAAERWLEKFEDSMVDRTANFADQARTGGAVARVFVALGRLRLDEAEEALGRIDPVSPVEELWVFVAVARATLALTRGDALAGLAALGEAEVAHRATTASVGIAPRLLAAVRADLLLAVGQGARARAVVAAGDDVTGTVALRRARVALVTGDPAGAAPMADAIAWGSLASTRSRIGALVVASLARWRMGSADGRAADLRAEAPLLLARAARLAEPDGFTQPFALAPRDELLEVAAAGPADGVVDRVLGDPALVAVGSPLPGRVPVAELSERELAVLAELATTRSLDVVAKRLFVSTNTVKTQVRSAYRKLGVHSRDEALSVAYRDGLLPS